MVAAAAANGAIADSCGPTWRRRGSSVATRLAQMWYVETSFAPKPMEAACGDRSGKS